MVVVVPSRGLRTRGGDLILGDRQHWTCRRVRAETMKIVPLRPEEIVPLRTELHGDVGLTKFSAKSARGLHGSIRPFVRGVGEIVVSGVLTQELSYKLLLLRPR